MEKRERGALLAHTDRFIKAKRNVLLWAVSLIALELVHTGAPLKPTALGTELQIPPKLLAIGIGLALLYHLWGFWIERRLVIWQNADLPGETEGTLAQRLERQEARVNELASALTVSGTNAQAAVALLRSDLSAVQQDAFEHRKEWMAYVDSIIADHKRLPPGGVRIDYQNLDNLSSQAGPILYEIAGTAVRPLRRNVRAKELDANLSVIEQSGQQADQFKGVLEDTYARLNRIGNHVDLSERRTFSWYDSVIPFSLAALALGAAGMDLFSDKPVATMLPAALRAVPATKAVNRTTEIREDRRKHAASAPAAVRN